MNDTVANVGIWTGAILGIAGVLAILWKVFRFLNRLDNLTQHELRHNSGSSMKDHAAKSVDLSQKTLDELRDLKSDFDKHILESNMWLIGNEREIGALTARVKNLEEQE